MRMQNPGMRWRLHRSHSSPGVPAKSGSPTIRRRRDMSRLLSQSFQRMIQSDEPT